MIHVIIAYLDYRFIDTCSHCIKKERAHSFKPMQGEICIYLIYNIWKSLSQASTLFSHFKSYYRLDPFALLSDFDRKYSVGYMTNKMENWRESSPVLSWPVNAWYFLNNRHKNVCWKSTSSTGCPHFQEFEQL